MNKKEAIKTVLPFAYLLIWLRLFSLILVPNIFSYDNLLKNILINN